MKIQYGLSRKVPRDRALTIKAPPVFSEKLYTLAFSRKFPRDELYGRRDWNIAADSAGSIPRDVAYAGRQAGSRIVTSVLPLSAFACKLGTSRLARGMRSGDYTCARVLIRGRSFRHETDPAVVFNDPPPFRHSRWQYLRQCSSPAHWRRMQLPTAPPRALFACRAETSLRGSA